MSGLIYLDNAATTRPFPKVVEAMMTSLKDGYYNPSSLYSPGYQAKKAMDACRETIKSLLSAEEVVFTSGGTEANNLAILGLMQSATKRGRVLYSAVEHSAVAAACQSLKEKNEVLTLPVDSMGMVDLNLTRQLMTEDTALICVMQVNNEVGSVQPLDEIIRLRDTLCPKAKIHVDGVQGFLKLPINLSHGIDSYALSGHKINGPKGIGALAFKKGMKLLPVVHGGKQENGLRSGTENTAGIAGLAAAIMTYPAETRMKELKIRLYREIMARVPQARLNGPEPDSTLSCPHILNLSFPPVKAQTMMNQLESLGVLVSQGSACSSRQKKPSLTLTAMGVKKEYAESAIRFSLSYETTQEEIDKAADAVGQAFNSLRNFTRR